MNTGAVVESARRRMDGEGTVDPWGLDAEAAGWAARAARLRWSISVAGLAHLPDEGPVLLVSGSRRLSLAPVAAAVALGQAAGRPIRFAGIPDTDPVTTALRRVGGVLAHPEEIAALLRADEVVMVWAGGGPLLRGGGRVGPVPEPMVAPAVDLVVPVLPVAILGRRFGRLLRVEVGAAVAWPRRRGPLAAAELAQAARSGVQTLLDEATPLRWPF